MRRRIIVELLTNYAPTDGDEIGMRSRMLEFVLNNAHCFDRSCEPGHITGSAWVVNPARSHVLLTHHRKLKRWFQPGGHSDGDHDTRHVAWREAREETGLPDVRMVTSSVFDLDIHSIPARKHEPEHLHYDVRFLFEADDTVPLVVSEESNALAWVSIEEVQALNNERSMLRMVEKTRQLKA